MNRKVLDEKFEAFADFLIENCDLGFILDRIPYAKKKEILEDWEAEQEKIREEADARADLLRKEGVGND